MLLNVLGGTVLGIQLAKGPERPIFETLITPNRVRRMS